MPSLSKPLRNELASAVLAARKLAEAAAGKALHALGVDAADPPEHLDTEGRRLRNRLRSQARQLGDCEDPSKRGSLTIGHLTEKIAYDHWHRLLFARFLAENDLLISPDHGVGVSLADCEELAPALDLRDGWEVATRFAARMLPQIFRPDDPADGVVFAPEDRVALRKRVTELSGDIFAAGDSLGWCYQFWQAERKEAVNKSGNKIGADELPAVTQLFTEDYMVDFLLDNTLGAWHAGKVLAANPTLAESARSEDELRQAVALPGCPWRYLRFIQGSADVSPASSSSQPRNGQAARAPLWTPAAGTFDGWPKTAAELKCLDPCMGSGHFVVAMFARLVALRLAEETLDEAAAVAAVIRDNLFGLEIDPRCTQIGAFNLALAAWRRVGHCKLPAMNLACSGLAPNARETDWLALAGDNEKLRNGMQRLYRLFQKAAVLGSLIDPRAEKGDLLEAGFHELQPLLEKALAQETQDATAHEMAVTARGLAKAAEILAGQFTLVATNVPYLGRGKQDEALMEYCDSHYRDAKVDLATCFVERSLGFCGEGASTALVTPQNWLFLVNYKTLRKECFKTFTWNCVARLGARAFETIGGEVVSVSLLCLTNCTPLDESTFGGIDAAIHESPSEKAHALIQQALLRVHQKSQLSNPDVRFIFSADEGVRLKRLGDYATLHEGMSRGDSGRFDRAFWELSKIDSHVWSPLLNSPIRAGPFEGREWIIMWEQGKGALASSDSARLTGYKAWKQKSVFVARTKDLRAVLDMGEIQAQNGAVLLPNDPLILPALWTFCSSKDFSDTVREFDQKIIVASGAFLAVPFDLAHWQKVAAEKYPSGLPKPHSDDPTQWLFYGHPNPAHPHGMLNRAESTDHCSLITEHSLQVAVARLLGYRWPRQTGSEFPDCPTLGRDGLEPFADTDGIVCISAIKGEQPAAERLRALLAAAFGSAWTAQRQAELLTGVGYAGKTLDDWLRNAFFEQHCQLFHHRPFIWHLWDGLRDGFSALVNYHKLTRSALEKLTYTYLGDWIGRQKAAVAADEEGSDAKLAAAQRLQTALKLIIEGEKPYDIFVRWKPLEKQPVGWEPDLNDGVRLNIRPFLSVPDVGKRGAGILRWKPNIKWDKDRGKDVPSAPWYNVFHGDRINDHHLTLAEKRAARAEAATPSRSGATTKPLQDCNSLATMTTTGIVPA